MVKKWVYFINLMLAGLCALLVLGSAALTVMRPSEIAVVNDVNVVRCPLPKNAFLQSKGSYDAIGAPCFDLKFSPSGAQLPDLRKVLVFHGRNGRPDAQTDKPLLHFSITGIKAIATVEPAKPLYISYDRKSFNFSPENRETPLWIVAELPGNEAEIRVYLRCETGEVISEPTAYAQFFLPEKEFTRFGGTPWEIGKWRVDGSLLARQRAKWYGVDRFLERHGGEEFQHIAGKHRLDFGEAEEVYSVFAALGDSLIWDMEKNRWREAQPGLDTLGKPLLLIKKIDDRLMNMELWDVDGRAKISLNLLKSTENWTPQNMQQAFKFLGARTRSQFVFEINNERMIISPKDWLLLLEKGWIKLETPEDIDAYVDRKVTGSLFVFDGIERREDKQVLVGTMFNSTRTEMQTIEMAVQQAGGPPANGPKAEIESEEDEDVVNESAAYKLRASREAIRAQKEDEMD